MSPPSTRSRVSGRARSSATAEPSSATCAAMPCKIATTRWPTVVDRVMPLTVALAAGRHQGAASPASAGTARTPPLSAAATSSMSAAVVM